MWCKQKTATTVPDVCMSQQNVTLVELEKCTHDGMTVSTTKALNDRITQGTQ